MALYLLESYFPGTIKKINCFKNKYPERSKLGNKLNITKKIRETLQDKTNLAVFIILCIAIIYATAVRFLNLGNLSFWGDDGMTYLSTVSVFEHGYPLLPSGYIMFHNIASDYFNIIPVLLFGDNEFAYRFLSALFGVLLVPLVFLFIKELANKYVALIASIVISANAWQIEYSREARYYSEFQFFYMLTIYFFYLGFFKDKKVFKVLAIISMFIATQIVTLGITLIFLFVPLLVYKGFKKFFKRGIIVPFLISGAILVAEIIHRELFWKIGLSFYSYSDTTYIANPIFRIIFKYFANFSVYYYKIFDIFYSRLYPVLVYGGIALILLYILFKPLRDPDEHNISIGSRRRISLNFPFNLFFLYFIFFSNTIFYGFGNMYNQQRYIYHMNPLFLIISIYVIFEISKIFVYIFGKIFSKDINIKLQKIKACSRSYLCIVLVIFMVLIVSLVNYTNPIQNFKITQRENGDPVNPLLSPSSTVNLHYDSKTAGKYIGSRLEEGDIVISTNPFNTFLYIKQMDYWMWSANLISWQPYKVRDGVYYDNFFGISLIRDLFDLQKVLNENSDKNVWIATTDSIMKAGHVDPLIYNFLEENNQYKMITGKDNISSAYLFPALKGENRNYSMYPNIIPGSNEIIKVEASNDGHTFLFNEPDNYDYLKYGWSDIESIGTWANQKSSVLFLDFEEHADYNLNITMMPLPDPDLDQEVEILLNSSSIGKFVLEDMGLTEYTVTIQEKLLTGEYNILEFRFKYLMSPIQLGINKDHRNLAVYFSKIDFCRQ